MSLKNKWTKLVCSLIALTFVWGGVIGCAPTLNEPESFTITFNSNGGSKVESISAKSGDVVKMPTAPTKNGYTFEGWYKGDEEFNWSTPIVENITLIAKWTPENYTIKYRPDGVAKDDYPSTYTIETETITLDINPTSPDSKKTKFVKWHIDNIDGDAVTELAKGSTGNKTFFAEFTEKSIYTVSYHDGISVVKTEEVVEGSTIQGAPSDHILFVDSEFKEVFNKETPITTNTTIYVRLDPFVNVTQVNNMPVISITANYLATSDEDGYVEKAVNDFVKLPVAAHVKEAEKGWGGTDYVGAPDPFYKDCVISVMDEDGEKSLFGVEAEVKVRGNWTTSYDKKPLRIKFGKKQSMLGLNDGNKFKNWVLLASYKDRSFLRDITGLTLGKLIAGDKYYASEFKLVEVYVNGEYLGVYVLAEQQEVKEDRIDINDAEENPSSQTGYLIEYDSYYHTEDEDTTFIIDHGEMTDRNGENINEFNMGRNILSAGYTIKNDLNNVEQKKYIADYMQKLWDDCYDAVNNCTEEESKQIINEKIDIDSLVSSYLLGEIVCDPDIYLTSFFMTLDLSSDGNKKLTFQAPWDFDSTMGNKRHDANVQGLYAGVSGYDVNYERKGTGNPWMILFANEKWFNDLVKEKWDNINGTIFSNVTSQISTLSSKYTTNFENNYKKWPMKDNSEYRPEAAACKTQSEAASQLTKWLNGRKVSLEKGINKFEEIDFSKAENEYFCAITTSEGIKIKFFLPEGVSLGDRYSANIKESTTEMSISLTSDYWLNNPYADNWSWKDVFTKENAVEILFPFVEKDKMYSFYFEGPLSSGDWFKSPAVTVKASDTVKPLDLTDFNKSTTVCVVINKDSEEYFVSDNDKAIVTKKKIYNQGYACNDIYDGVWGYAAYSPNANWAWSGQEKKVSETVGARVYTIDEVEYTYETYAASYTIQVTVRYDEKDFGWKTPSIWSETCGYGVTTNNFVGSWKLDDNSGSITLVNFNDDFTVTWKQGDDEVLGIYGIGGNCAIAEFSNSEEEMKCGFEMIEGGSGLRFMNYVRDTGSDDDFIFSKE